MVFCYRFCYFSAIDSAISAIVLLRKEWSGVGDKNFSSLPPCELLGENDTMFYVAGTKQKG